MNPSTNEFPESNNSSSGLWQYSIRLYAAPGMESLCLRLQDGHGVNICLLLWCLWLDQSGRTFDTKLLRQGQRRANRWHCGLVAPLRLWRRSLSKQGSWAAWRKRLQSWEIRAERAELNQLESLVADQEAYGATGLTWEYTRQILGQSALQHLPTLREICSGVDHSAR
ncbi:TIGR02444 family protein [Pseudomaricurvus alkylphenolicus]|jgi:uncharacterized protein (TIGR02444 family)|uniref:TIGR02444 family protein n=1 Tax=Pseudomaricurvus alkylphenolicus TaxID=1306991 RepID=UPI00141F1257|nr:TIGR02444 family protein [Pseudomaricurvus alkylphenolicus]